MIRVFVSVGSAVVRAGLEALVDSSPALTLAGSGALDGDLLAEQIEDLQPDVVLLELKAEDEESVPALLAVPAGSPSPAIVLLADQPRGAWVIEALRAGARAVLSRDAAAEEILAAIEAAAAGLVVFHPDDLESLLPAGPVAARLVHTSPHQALTRREIEVLGMLAEGLANKEIASRLGISEHTVKFHINSIFNKLDASTRTEAVTTGIRQGLIMV